MKIRFLNLSRVNYKDYKKGIKKVFKSGIFILGNEVKKFEKKISKKLKRKVIAVSSGTDALILSLKILNIQCGDEVILPNISYVATANAITLIGAKPVFCDVEDNFNLNPNKIEKLITNKTKAIIMVHYGGSIGKIDKVRKIAKKYNLYLIEDAAQAFMAKKGNKLSGTFGDIACFSLNPMKVLGAFGEAGMVVTDDRFYKKAKMFRNNGVDDDKVCKNLGFNAKIDTLQAAILNQKLKYLKKSIKKRQKIAKKYTNSLKNLVTVPIFSKDNVYFTYTILTDKRDELKTFLDKKGIETKIYHTAITKEIPYKNFHHNDLNNSIKLSDMKLALPCNEYLSDKEVDFVIESIKEFFNV
jgi:dTDP-4-amino-4,6-dideoxygalactose transaminase